MDAQIAATPELTATKRLIHVPVTMCAQLTHSVLTALPVLPAHVIHASPLLSMVTDNNNVSQRTHALVTTHVVLDSNVQWLEDR